MRQVAIGIDIGGTNTAIGVIDREGNVLYEKQPQLPTPQKRENPYAKIDKSDELCTNYIAALSDEVRVAIETVKNINPDLQVMGIGIGAPNANYYRGTIEFAANLPFVGVVQLADLLQAKLPEINIIKVTNDANAAALGELIYGGGIGMHNFVMITLGTGLGSGIIVNGDLVYGQDGFAGELGHVTIIPEGRACGCGGKGHLETYCSATGIKRSVFEMLAKNNNSESLLANIPFNDMTAKMVYDAAEKGDPIALEVFEYSGELLGRSLADTVHYLSPEAIFLFGGAAAAGDYIFKPTKESMERYLLPVYRNKVQILPSKLKEGSAAIVGASALVWKELDKISS
ncbi:MAG: ROK family protein [Bacteroidetes bacterium]|nr:ROK family protein [Bacteroidota bacterium]MCL6103767.1 ROK family protein [Bacteroidota bacterium]